MEKWKQGLGFGGVTPITDNLMEKKMENEMDTEIIQGLIQFIRETTA